DVSALRPGGIPTWNLLRSPVVVSRSTTFEQVAVFIHEGLEIMQRHKGQFGKTMKDFKAFIETNKEFLKEIEELAERVEAFSMKFDIPGDGEF
ncbi:hypothetical protein COOONC_17931, partial [Cooperia oncophora]